MKEILKRLKDPTILAATIANIVLILELCGVFTFFDIDTNIVTKIVTLLISILLQVGILKQPNSTK